MGAMLAGVFLWACLEATFRQSVVISLKGEILEYYFHNREFAYAFKVKNVKAMKF